MRITRRPGSCTKTNVHHMPTRDQTKALYKLTSLLTASQRLQDRINLATATVGMSSDGITQLSQASLKQEDSQAKLVLAINAQITE
jgi:hypothetical protein